MNKNEYERLKNIASEKLKESSLPFPEDFSGKSFEELTQINEIYQAELEAQNDELQFHILDLEEAQVELEILFTNAPIAYTLMTNKFNVLRANEKVFTMFNPLHFLSKKVPFYTHIYKNHLTKFLDWINNKEKENIPLEILLKTKDGLKYCSLHYHKWSMKDNDTFLLSIIDIHAQKEENDRFKALFKNSQQGVVYLDKNNRIVDLNQTASDIIEEEGSCISKSYSDLDWTFLDGNEHVVKTEDLPFTKAIETKEIQKASVFAIYKSISKKTIWLKMEAIPHLSPEDEEIIGVFCIFTDVTKEYILDKEVTKQLENFKTLGNNIPDVILRIDEEQNILFANEKAIEFFDIENNSSSKTRFCDFPIFKTEQAKNIHLMLNDLTKLTSPITYSLNYKNINKNKNYFIRIVPEESNNKKKFLIIVEDITERVESEDMFDQLFFHASDAIILTDHRTGEIKSINKKASKLLGIEEKDKKSIFANDIFAIFDDKNKYFNHLDALKKFGVDNYESNRTLENGQVQYLKIYCTLIDIGNDVYHQSIVHDLTEHKLLELQVQQTSKVFEHTVEGIMITKLNGSIISVNDAFTKITGYTREEIIGKKPSMLRSGRQDELFYKRMWDDICNKGTFRGEIWNKKKDGTIYPEWLTVSTIYDKNQKAIQYVAVFSDFSEIKKTQNKLENLAHYDPLTKLPNRLLLKQAITHFIKTAKRHKNKFAVLFIDLDSFKQINDTYGHETGDEVLKITANRLKSVLRESDVVARLGGDEFIVIINEITNIESTEIVAKNILNKLKTPFVINNQEHNITCSIGISVYPEDTQDDDIGILIKNADKAMYESKSAGKNNYHYFSKNRAEDVTKISNLDDSLNESIQNQEFDLTYQPLYDI